MAFYSDDEDKNQAASGGQGGGAAIGPSGSSLVGGGGGQASSGAPAPGGAAQPAPAKTSTPGNKSPFVGINQYLNTNKQQSQKLGGTVGNFVGGKLDNASTHLNEAGQQFGKTVDQNTVRLDDNLLNEIKSDPTKVAHDQAKLQQAKAMQKGYGGPTDFKTDSSFQSVNPELEKAKQTRDNLGSAQGQTSILQNQQAETRGGKINRGAATLDQALLSASPEARAALQPTIAKGKEFDNTINQTISSAMNKVSGAKQQSEATNKAVNDLYNQQFEAQKSSLNQRAADTNANLKKQAQEMQGRFFGGATDQDLQSMGMNRQDYSSLMNDFNQYGPQEGLAGPLSSFQNFFQAGNPNATAQNVATSDDYARAQALNQLAGYGGEYLSNPAQADSYNKNVANFDYAGARNFINDKKSKGEAAQRAAQQRLNEQQQMQNAPGQAGDQARGATQGPIGGAVGGAVNSVKSWSDKNLKTDIKPFHAKEFLDAISQGKKKQGVNYGVR